MKNRIVVTKKENENSNLLYRNFNKKFKNSGIKAATRGKGKFRQRKPSAFVKKKDKLISIAKGEKYRENVRLGKISTSYKA